ncbi:MAG: hypothetical protein ABIS67_12360 [Candidatus Eisenbacteria bacterium]
MPRLSFPGWNLPLLAGALCAAGFVLLAVPRLLAAALGVECIAAAFWLSARAAEDPSVPLRRWEWLRRPATALWVAVVLQWLQRAVLGDGIAPESLSLAFIQSLGRLAVCWAGLDLLGALPGARTFSDRSGPLAGGGFRMPALLPPAGALIFLRQPTAGSLEIRGVDVVQVVLVVAAGIAVLRAFGRRSWRRCLRWLLVTECALAALLAAVAILPIAAALTVWAGACGGLALWLIAEHRGAALRRTPGLIQLWRAAGWTSTTALGWPLVLGFAHGVRREPALAVAVSLVTAMAAWIVVRRPQPAPERRGLRRPAPPVTFHRVAALLTLTLGPLSLAAAWSQGFRPPLVEGLLALAPFVLGGALAMLPQVPLPRIAARGLAHGIFHMVARAEHQLVARAGRAARSLASPLRDLHTGDAQEYLLFLVGMCVIMLLLPVLQ